ncbi:MAG TPA: class I SAM-dependent methyltransferase [Nannocystaceae bacterium]|nr:class I SAM-dependent methyltransferase [Nannocystaceae bacterium]
MRAEMVDFYRRGDDVGRYVVEHETRRRVMAGFHRAFRPHLGRVVLDVACGGGILGAILEPHGHRYVGVDINPDMIRAGKEWARANGSRNRFVLGDAATVELSGRFDTVTLLGNASCHIEPVKLGAILRNLARHLRRDATFVIDYRDVVEMLDARQWRRRAVERRNGRVTRFEATECDTVRGSMVASYRPDGDRRVAEFRHAIWSPFIMSALLEGAGWRLLARKRLAATTWLWTDAYVRAPRDAR